MNDDFSSDVASDLRALADNDPDAQRVFDWLAGLKNDAKVTTIARVSAVAGVSYGASVRVMKALSVLGVGRFISGRKGHESRFEWAFSRVSIGRVALRGTDAVENVSPEAVENDDAETTASGSYDDLSIAQAKTLLARSFGVPEDNVTITVTS